MPQGESHSAIRDLGVKYQLVTDETPMLVLGDDAFTRHGIERRNQQRVALEQTAQSARAAAPQPVNYRVDTAAADDSFAGADAQPERWWQLGGGGALPPFVVIAMAVFSALALRLTRRGSSAKN